MTERSVEIFPTYKIFRTTVHNQTFLSAAVTSGNVDPNASIEEIYTRITGILSAASLQIVHERCFANVGLHKQILEIREKAFQAGKLETDTPMTFVEGESCMDNSFSGVQIRALKPLPGTKIRTILDGGVPRGRSWSLNGSTFYLLQGVDGGTADGSERANRKFRSEAMFRQAENLLRSQGATYRDVVRTWIYISDILDWYDDFNAVRNHCYSEYGFLGDAPAQAEQIYLPASTGIEGRNPNGLPAVMDVLAIHSTPGSSIKIRPVYGTKQRSPYRYGSAFSRAVVIEEPSTKLILVSGTASIDESGKSVFIGDAEAQIRQTLSVISSLIAPEKATLNDLCEATVFLKRKEDYPVYRKVIEELGISEVPTVNVVADVCRDELLFELDAAFILGTARA